MAAEKKGFLKRLFSSPDGSSSKTKVSDDSKVGQDDKRKNHHRSSTVSPSLMTSPPTFQVEQKSPKPKDRRTSAQSPGILLSESKQPERRSLGLLDEGPSRSQPRKKPTRPIKETRFRRRKPKGTAKVDASKPLKWPCTPEILIEYHKQKPLLNHNEEWLIMELNEYECLIESMEIVKLIAKHSKFFELEPEELWAEFFEFMEEVPSYDEMINFDVWQEFRDKRYPC